MARILAIEPIAPGFKRYLVEAPEIARKHRAGQFVIVLMHGHGERIPLTIADRDAEAGTITLVVQEVGKSTMEMGLLEAGSEIDVVGPLGTPTHVELLGTAVCVGGGAGIAPLLPIARALKEAGNKVVSILGGRSQELVILRDEMAAVSDQMIYTTDDGSFGRKGLVTHALADWIADNGHPEQVIAIGPGVMMKAVAELTRPLGIPTVVSLNTIMIDGTGMCGGCRVAVAGESKFVCVDGPEFDAHKVDFDLLLKRQRIYLEQERIARERFLERHRCSALDGAEVRSMTTPLTPKERMKIPRQPMPAQDAEVRRSNFNEVALGFTEELAVTEALRCLACKKPKCIDGCPVGIDIPAFVAAIEDRRFEEALAIIKKDNTLPAICGRVCPQEDQCEKVCVVGNKHDPVAIGRLERYVADLEFERGEVKMPSPAAPTGYKVAIVGSGPAGLACAADLAMRGHAVTVLEALHKPGGVLIYGIPEFRLPKAIVDEEISNLRRLGVDIRCNYVVGKIASVEDLLGEQGYDAVFLGTGAGLPYFMGIPGENSIGVYSANEFLTRVNLMKAFAFPDFDTPVAIGRRVAVVGSGNVAMDCLRTALRLGAEQVVCLYRRTRAESPARLEELEHAEEEGIDFRWLTSPVEIYANDDGLVTGVRVIQMELGEPDASGRRRPVPKPGSEYDIELDTVVMGIGQGPNPLVTKSTEGLTLNRWGNIVVDETTMMTSIPGVFAGGDIVTGAATVILAMGAGKKAAEGIDRYLRQSGGGPKEGGSASS